MNDFEMAQQMSDLLRRWCHELSCDEVETLERETKALLYDFDQTEQRRLAA